MQRDAQLQGYIGRFAGQGNHRAAAVAAADDPAKLIYLTVLRGEESAIAARMQKALDAGIAASALVDDCLIPAINEVGEKYDRKEYFLPQLIMSADTMRKGFEFLEPLLSASREGTVAGPLVIMATVKGDIHDIGKNIVCLMLRNYGFRVIDLGKDVAADRIVAEVRQSGAAIVGLSALMTTTMTEMRVVIEELKAAGLSGVKVMIGGAVVDQAYADEIGADAYSADAMDAVRVAGKLAAG